MMVARRLKSAVNPSPIYLHFTNQQMIILSLLSRQCLCRRMMRSVRIWTFSTRKERGDVTEDGRTVWTTLKEPCKAVELWWYIELYWLAAETSIRGVIQLGLLSLLLMFLCLLRTRTNRGSECVILEVCRLSVTAWQWYECLYGSGLLWETKYLGGYRVWGREFWSRPGRTGKGTWDTIPELYSPCRWHNDLLNDQNPWRWSCTE